MVVGPRVVFIWVTLMQPARRNNAIYNTNLKFQETIYSSYYNIQGNVAVYFKYSR